MTSFILTVDEQTASAASTFDEVFLWTRSAESTYTGTLDPYLTIFGPVRQENVDFVRIALAVFSADRSVRRKARGSDWNDRDFELTVEVSNPAAWQTYAAELAQAIGFLTGDHWSFFFTQAADSATAELELEEATPTATVLLSGGADSAAGALLTALSLDKGSTLQLVSHFSAMSISPFQKDLVKRIKKAAPDITVIHRQTNLNRTAKRLDGTDFKSEPSSRSRSLLFLALGLAAAERSGQPLLIPENGFASLNPPLGPERRGSLSTHTTHPRFLAELQEVLTKAGAHGLIQNPFQSLTKGQMFTQVADKIGASEASEYLSATNSCSHTDARYSGVDPGSSCGVCFGCLVRRASFHAASITDATKYLSDDAADRYATFVSQKSIVEAMHDFAAEDPKPRMVMKMSLPKEYPPRDALALCEAGVRELRAFLA
ncbi:queuosine biosynthesis protein queC [Mycobacteroides abscessus subsp. abscessus]|uniref:7-cyano-7-deazaguanine synthase n=1 Tax=Mycobacteroides abscessus TaxID=36809 RepID=UPI00092AFD89|nr:7-cyano-7-deazaguanine synthase [Mycobacteroides abscessus]SHY17539.1 queuosine biosynthesis protein queC [Mycobacteroides abscessus subsp. abscessus]